MSCVPTTTTSCVEGAAAPLPPVVFLPALVFAVALVVFVVLSLRRAEDAPLRLLAGVTLPIMAVLQIVAVLAWHFGTAVVAAIAGIGHLE